MKKRWLILMIISSSVIYSPSYGCAECFDSLFRVKPIAVFYDFFQPVKYNMAVRNILDKLINEDSGQYFLIVRGVSDRGLENLLTSKLYFKISNVPIIINDSIFAYFSPDLESGLLINKPFTGSIFYSVFTTPLEKIFSQIKSQSIFSSIDSFKINDNKYPCSGSDVFIKINRDSILLFNRAFNELLIYSLSNGELMYRYPFNYNYDKLYIQTFGKDSIQLSYAKTHRNIFLEKKLPFNECNVLSIQRDTEYIYLAFLFYFIRFDGLDSNNEDSISLRPQNFIFKCKIEKPLDPISYFLFESFSNLPDNYDFWLYHSFVIKNNVLIVPVLKSGEDILSNDTLRILASYRLKTENFEFQRIEKYRLPYYYIEHQLFYSQSTGKFFNWKDTLYYQFLIYPFAYNLMDGLSFSINDSCYKSAEFLHSINFRNKRYLIYDVGAVRNGTYLCYIYQCNEQLNLLILSNDFEEVQNEELAMPYQTNNPIFQINNQEIDLLSVEKTRTLFYEYHFKH